MLAWVSRDIFVQDIPDDITSVEQIPDEWMPSPLGVTTQAVRDTVIRQVPHANFDDPNLGYVSLSGADIEVSLSDDVPLMSFAFHVRGDRSTADRFVSEVLASLQLRAFDPESDSGLFEPV